ncbi:glycosyltransferase family 4 protein [Rhizobium sp. BK251]|uniref:glycosyltransferase family 4 protein n=1 Tax=Rhizobium sp. BK251 TaxID=2512125 RepID=UPI001052B689|nr:glycosyltransferase family 4 protein [Rhizobium sp. BK251]
MRIAFYAPLKHPAYPVPSGDRLMARLLIAALEKTGHSVEVASELRSLSGSPDGPERVEIERKAQDEVRRLAGEWRKAGPPDLWFSYHPYYKSPDLIGPSLCREFAVAYATVEASYSRRRNESGWGELQATVADAVRQAAINICMTVRDQEGLSLAIPEGRYARLKPFIDVSRFEAAGPAGDGRRLVAVAMMRRGDKLASYAMLARALERLADRDWTLTLIGDGPARAEVEAMFATSGSERIEWLGERSAEEVARLLSKGGIYVWPGCGEAYGLAYLEAQAAGLPVVAQATAGVPEVVMDGITGYLTPDGDTEAYASAIRRLLDDAGKRSSMGAAARQFVVNERSLDQAAHHLDSILRQYVEQRR